MTCSHSSFCVARSLQIEQREADDAAKVDVSESDDGEEMRWYTEQAARLEKFKAALNAVRLQPDEFRLLLPLRWAMRDATSSSRELVPYLLRINARSQLTFVPSAPGAERSHSSSEAEPAQRSWSEDGFGGGGMPRVFFMDTLRQVRLTQAEGSVGDAGAPAAISTCACGGDSSSSGGSGGGSSGGSSSRAPPPPRALCIELVGEPPLTCVTPEASELVEVLGAHLRRYNASRVAQVRALKGLHQLKGTAYDARQKSHEKLLQRLWVCGFGPAEPCLLHSERWVHLGFQSADPAKDFRGMGVLGLANLVYFGEHYADVFQRLVAAQRKRDYPLACAGINITSLLLELLNMKDDGDPSAVQDRMPFDPEWGCDMFHFFCHMFYRDRAFEDMYCFCLRLLDRMYVSMDADYADFNTVLAALKARLVDALAQRPLSFREFKRLIAAGSTDSEGSVHSSGITGSTVGPGSNSSGDEPRRNGVGSEMDPEQLANTIAEAVNQIGARVDGITSGLKGVFSRTRPGVPQRHGR